METRNAWKSTGVTFAKRSRNTDRSLIPIVETGRFRGIINLGNLDLNFDGITPHVFNRPDTIRSIGVARTLFETLGEEFVPSRDLNRPHWHKTAGFRGFGKVYHDHLIGECAITPGGVQEHIEGTEFRVITVGDVIVQAHRKTGNYLDGFDWDWVGIDGIRTNGIIPHIKAAVENIPIFEYTVFGWDIIHDGVRPWTIEINSCPGVNEATVQRIVDQVRRVI